MPVSPSNGSDDERVETIATVAAATAEPAPPERISVEVRVGARQILASPEALGEQRIQLEPGPAEGVERLSWAPHPAAGASVADPAADVQDGAAAALVDASRACSSHGQLDEALSLSERALEFGPFGPALFQSAKVLMALGCIDDGLTRLAGAIEEYPAYVLHAAADPDFQAHAAAFEDWARSQRQSKEGELRALYGELSEDNGFWFGCLQQGVDLGPVSATIARPRAGLFDVLSALRILRQVRPIRSESAFRNAADAARVFGVMPRDLPCRPELLARLVEDSRDWRLNAPFFALTRALAARGELQALREILCDRTDANQARLEFFAARIDAFPSDPGGRSSLVSALQRRSIAARADLIAEYEALLRSGMYRHATVEVIRIELVAQYEIWWPGILKSHQRQACSATDEPTQGAAARGFAAGAGFLLPAVGLNLLIDPPFGLPLAIALWVAGVAGVVWPGIARRVGIRRERLRSYLVSEQKLRAALAKR
jgi:hypothetical protein